MARIRVIESGEEMNAVLQRGGDGFEWSLATAGGEVIAPGTRVAILSAQSFERERIGQCGLAIEA